MQSTFTLRLVEITVIGATHNSVSPHLEQGGDWDGEGFFDLYPFLQMQSVLREEKTRDVDPLGHIVISPFAQ